MIFSLFSPGKVDDFARELAQDVARRYPPAIANNPGRSIPKQRLTAILEETFSGAHRFNRENRLGIFRKAKLGNAFQWLLKEMGYDESFVQMATKALLVSLTRQPPGTASHADKSGALD